MKKLLSIAAMAAISVSVFTACSDDGTPGPDPSPVNAGEGVFVVNAGTMGNIPGSLTFIGNDGGTLQDAFAKANNNMALGDTPNDAIVYGSKLYIVVNGDYCVWVVDRRKLNVLYTDGHAGNQRSVYRYARDFFEAYCAPVGSTSSPDFSFLTQDHSAVLQQPAVN